MGLKEIIAVGIGSCIGGMARYGVSFLINKTCNGSWPWGTWAVNIIGCFLIGLFIGWQQKTGSTTLWYLLLTTGVLGGFTTFSAFSLESIMLIKAGAWFMAIAYLLGSVMLGLLSTSLALYMVK